MAGFRKIYTSQNEFLEDVAPSNQFFDADYYEIAKEAGRGGEYLQIMAGTKDQISSSFDENVYVRLSGADKFNYYVTENLLDKNSEDYKTNKAYFDQQIKAIKNQEIYDSLNGFEKTMATIGGWFGSLGLGVYGLGEGLIDAAALIGGGVAGLFDNQIWENTKDFMAKDTTGYNAAQQALTDFRQAYTFENKQQWMGAINDVFGAIGQMAPMLVTGGASAAVKAIGTTAYYVGMAGNTAEQAVVANPDIEYWKLLTYTGAVTGVEALTEWGSGKIFGEGLIGVTGFNPKQISGSMFKTILHNMGTEAAEEAVSELFGGILEYYLVTEDRESLPTLEKVLYAALIGGLTGGVLAGGRITLTPRMSVTSEGQVKYNKDLTIEERANAKKLGLRKSWAVQSLLQQSSDALNSVDEITKLQTKYGNLSLDQIKTQHADEYQKAVEVDTETKTQQAKSFLSLAKLMNEIGEQNFKEAVDLLNDSVEDAKRMADNYINHRAEGNKKASEVFAVNYPNRSFTPSTIPSKTNQTLAEAIRKAFPNINVVFGTFGDKDGDPIRAINGTETYLFIDENFAAKHGTQALVEAVRYQLADELMSELEIFDKAEVDGLVKLFTDTDVTYSKLSKEQKRTIAQILCFDVVNSRKLFRNSLKTHKKIFKYFTDQSEYVKKFGRQTEANKIRYHDLLSIRNMYIQNIVDTIGNIEDARAIAKEYSLSEEELQTKIIDKMMTTNANDVVKLTKLQQVKEACQKRDAFNELYNSRVDNTEDFDFDRMYEADYYSPDFITTVSQNNADFKQALQEYILTKHGIAFVDKTKFDIACNNMLSAEMVEQFSKDFLTKEFLDTNPSYADKKAAVVEAVYMLSQTGADLDGDSVVVTDTEMKGTGQLHFMLGENINGENLLSQEQRGNISTSTGDVFKRMAPDSAEYSTTKFNNVEVDVQNDATLDEHQKALLEDCKNKYGLDLHFYKGAINYDGIILDNANGFVSDNNVYLRYDGTLTNEEINNVIDHEATHRRIDAEPEKYKSLRDVLRKAMDGNEYKKWYDTYERLYGEIYKNNEDLIEEEMIVNIISGAIKPTYHAAYKDVVKPWIGGFKKTSTKLMKKKISTGVKFSVQNNQNTSIQQKINKAESPKQIADVITAIIEAAPTEISATKGYGDEGTRLYKKTSDEMRRKYASLWSKITQDNYDKVRNELIKSDYEYADEALLIFDRFTRAYSQLSTKFDAETKEKILKNASKKQTIAAISQGLQSAELANEHSFGEISAKFEEDGYKVKVSDQTVAQYVPEMANKKEFVKQLDKEISDIEEQIKTAETDLDAAALNNQLDKTIEKRIVMAEGTNEEVMDWVIKNEDIVTKASKLQKEVFEQMVEKGEKATETPGKKAITILVDEKTGLPKPFPKATKIVEDSVKKLKSFRMWAMLTSPVSWVRNWVGNSGMTALDSMTNSLEKFIASKQPKITEADLAKLEKQYKELASKEKPTDADKVKMAQLSNQMERYYDFKFVETKASKELRTQIANDYKDVIQQILNGEDVKYESSAEKAAAITRAERKITQASQNANLGQKLWAACQSMTDWGLNTGWFGDNAVVVNSLVKNFANMVESNKTYLLKSLKTEYGNDGRGMSDARKKLVENALKSQKSIDIVNAMSKSDVSMFMDSCKQRTFEQYFKNSNWLSQWASNLSKKHPIAASLTSLVLPFPKVAANILSMAYKYSPLGFLSAARQWSVVKQMDAEGYAGVRDAFARAKAGRTTAQATVGSFMMLAGLILAALGFVDIDEDDYMGPSLKMGDFKISLSNLAPSMTTFSVGSAMLWAWKNDKSATLQALNVLYDNTLLGNIENVFKYGSSDKYIQNLSINYFSQYVPAMLKLFTKFTTNQEMIDKSGSYWEKLGKTFASGIPFVANALPKKINPYTGEVLTGTGSQNVFFNFIEALSPLDFRSTSKPATQKEAERLGTESSGLSGTFKINDIEYDVDKVTYGKYRANYIEENFEKILSGKQKVTVEDENGKRITTTYDKLTDKQKKNVINRLYTDATSMTKIKWWTDQGNTYVVTDRDLYNEYRKMFSNIVYKKNWSKSKFVES